MKSESEGILPGQPTESQQPVVVVVVPGTQSPAPSQAPESVKGKLKRLTETRLQPALRFHTVHRRAVRLKEFKTDKLLAEEAATEIGATAQASGIGAIHEQQLPFTEATPRRETADPFMRNRPKRGTGASAWVAFPFLMGATVVALLLCFGIDVGYRKWPLNGHVAENDYRLKTFAYVLLNPYPDQARGVLQAVTNTMAFVFIIQITIIGIILQFASQKITSHVTSLFFRDRVILGALTFVLVSNAFSLVIYLECGNLHSPRFGVFMSVLMTDILLVMLFPFLAYLFFFLDAEEVVTKIVVTGLNAVIASINKRHVDLEKNQVTATLSIEYLMDGALSSIKKKNKNITGEIIDAFCSFTMHYSSLKDKAPDGWFEIPLWIRQSPDFFILNDDSIKDLVDRKLWMEWKVLRQYQNIFTEAIKFFKEMCYHICINTKIIAETAANFNQLQTTDLCIKFFNSFLRMAINLNDVRVVYNVLFQYRQLAEILLEKGRGSPRPLALRALKIAKFIRYYAFICNGKELFFLVETVAQDLRVLCETSMKSAAAPKVGNAGKAGWNPVRAIYGEVHEKLLSIFLSLGDFAANGGAKRGVVRAQVILATFYITEEQLVHARKVFKQLDKPENKELLLSLREELTMAATKEFWEVSERGYNFAYLEPRLRSCLFRFFGWFPWGAAGKESDEFWAAFQQSKEGKQLRVQQELQNFEAVLEESGQDGEEEEEEEEDGDDEDEVGDGAGTSQAASSRPVPAPTPAAVVS